MTIIKIPPPDSMQSIEQHLLPLIKREAIRINDVCPGHEDIVDALVREFTATFRESLLTYSDALDLCGRVQNMLTEHPDIPEEILREINTSRQKILFEIIQHGLEHRTLSGAMPIEFTPQFPPRNTGKRTQNARNRSVKEYEEVVQQQNYDLLRIATHLGVDAAADVLCALGQIDEAERSRVISFISAYLGRCERPIALDLPGLLAYPKPVLEVPSVRSVVRRLLLQDTYGTLMQTGADDPATHADVRKRAGGIALQRMTDLGRNACVTDPAIHAGLFVELSNFMKRSCTQSHPKNLVRSVRENGKDCPFPSLRQLIATELLHEQRTLYVGYEPGKGKTPIPFLLMEQLRQEGKNPRMLYLGPLPVIQELPNRIRPGSAPQPTRDCYFVDPETAPTVGIIDSSLSNEEIADVIAKPDITFGPYSMIHSERKADEDDDEEVLEKEAVRLIDLLCAEQWDILVLDEAHYVDGNKTWTKLLDRLIHHENGQGTHLSKNGFIVAMSGSPIMNTVADPVMIHDLFLPPAERRRQYGMDTRDTQGRDMKTERGLHPLLVRQALNQTLLTLDSPEPWLENVDILDYELSPQEMEFLRGICSNSTLHAKHKLDACLQFILCPKLVSGDDRMPESLLEWVKMQLDHDLRNKQSVLIAENMRAQGVVRDVSNPDAENPNTMELHFYRKIEEYCAEWATRNQATVHFHIVHGKTPQDERQISYADAANARRSGEHKTVMLAMSQCLNVGIRLGVDRIISLEWPYNSPEVQQLLKRALREGDTDVRLTACYALGTVQQGIYDQSMDKYRDGLQCQYGTGVSDAMLRSHIREREEDPTPESESELFRLLLRTSPIQRRYEIERWLHGRGTNGVTQFWDRHRDLFAMLSKEADEMGTGDMQRFLAGLISGLMDRGMINNPTLLDINGGGLTLERELRRLDLDENIVMTSTDPLSWMFEHGRNVLFKDDASRPSSTVCTDTTPDAVQRLLQTGQLSGAPYDIAIMRNLEQCNHIQSDITVHERARALLGLVSGVRISGHIVIPLSRTACTNEEFETLISVTLPRFGCLAKEGWHGSIRSKDNENDEPFRGFCVVAEKVENMNEQTLREQIRATDLRFTHHSQWANTAEGVRVTNAMKHPKLPYPLRHSEFQFGNRTLAATNNEDVRAKQIHHLQSLEFAVRSIQSLAAGTREWKNLTSSQRRGLDARGILYSADLSQTLRRPTFSLREFPGHLFFPFDQQWK